MSTPVENIDTLIVGAGQAGIAMSEHLGIAGVPHLVLERNRVAESWRSCRWDSLVANGPAWHDRFPGLEFPGISPDGFPTKDGVVDYFIAYANQIDAPIRCGVEVTRVKKNTGRRGFRVETSSGVIEANNVIAATGPFQHPVIPPVIPAGSAKQSDLVQIHSNEYRNPAQLPDGAVVVVGAGSSGAQIADELQRSGKQVYLSVGPHDRPPRSYRGRDFVWWLGVLGKWDTAAMEPGREHITISVSGAYGGHTIDFRRLANEGIVLVGLTQSYSDGVLKFARDLADNIAQGDANYLSVLNEADAYIEHNGLDLPPEPQARVKHPDPDCLTNPVVELDLVQAGVSSIIWATGYVADYSWLELDVFDDSGKPVHKRGVTSEPGILFLGLPWQSRRGSAFIWGVWHDAKHLADHITTQNKYLTYGS